MIFPNLILLLFSVVAADLLITYPAGGETLTGDNEYTVTWMESNIVPIISDLDSYTILLYAGSNDNYTEMARSSPSSFAQPNAFANVLSLNVEVGPDSNNDAYFLGIVSTLKANNSIQVINFSNRFNMADMSVTLTFDPPVQNTGIAPPATREFNCSSQLCSSEDALSGISLATPVAPAVTSIPASAYNLGASEPGSDYDVFSFNVVAVTLGVAGILFTISCLATFFLFRRREDGNGNFAGRWRNPVSFRLGKSRLLTQPTQYLPAELPDEEKINIFELSAGSMKSRASNTIPISAHELSATSIGRGDVEQGVPGAAGQSGISTRFCEILEARETTTLLSTDSSHSRMNSVTGQTPLYLPPRPPLRQAPVLRTE